MGPKPVLSFEEWAASLCEAAPATRDDVPITSDGRRLDSKEKVLNFLAEIEAERADAAAAQHG